MRTTVLTILAVIGTTLALPTTATAADHRCDSAAGEMAITRNADQIDVTFQCEGGSEHSVQSVAYTDPGSGDEKLDNESICESLLEEFCPDRVSDGGDGTRYTCEDETGVMLITWNADQLDVQYACTGQSELSRQSVIFTDPASGDVDLDNEVICADQLLANCGDEKFDDVEDMAGDGDDAQGCSIGGQSAPFGLALVFLALGIVTRRRR